MKKLKITCLSLSLFLLTACGGGSGNSLSATDVGDVSSTFNALEGLLFDTSSTSSKANIRAQETEQKFSMMGCHYKQDRKRILQSVNQVRVPLCFINKVEENITTFKVGEGEYKYYEISGKPGDTSENQDEAFKLRLGKFDVNGKKCLKFQRCKGTELVENFEACETEDGVSASAQHKFDHSFSDANGSGEFTGMGSLALTAKGTKVDGAIELTEFSLNNAHEDASLFTMGEDTFEHSFKGSATLTGNKTEKKNTFTGSFENENTGQGNSFSNNSDVCVVAGQGEGSGRVVGNHAFPAYLGGENYYCPPAPGSCDPLAPNSCMPVLNNSAPNPAVCSQSMDFTESFAMTGEGETQICYLIPNEDSMWASAVSSCNVDRAVPTDIASDWDCTGDFVAISMADLPQGSVDECIELEGKYEVENEQSCEEKYKEENPPVL